MDVARQVERIAGLALDDEALHGQHVAFAQALHVAGDAFERQAQRLTAHGWVRVRQEVPLERCDLLHVIPVNVGSHPFRFLVDTGATSMLDLHSFSEGSSKDIQVTSWSGTFATSGSVGALPSTNSYRSSALSHSVFVSLV